MKRPTASTTQWIATAACAFIAAGSLAVSVLFVVDSGNDDRKEARQTVDTGYLGCLRYNDTRLLFRQIILDAYGTGERPQFDITSLPQYQAINDVEKLKRMHGPGFFGAISRVLGPSNPRPLFLRPSYQASILDNLKAFYAARPRPWRPANRSSCKPTSKERLKAQRRAGVDA